MFNLKITIMEKIAKELVTMDGKTVPEDGWMSVFMVLAGMTENTLREFGGEKAIEVFSELADNFILSNTKKNIDLFLTHTVLVKIAELKS